MIGCLTETTTCVVVSIITITIITTSYYYIKTLYLIMHFEVYLLLNPLIVGMTWKFRPRKVMVIRNFPSFIGNALNTVIRFTHNLCLLFTCICLLWYHLIWYDIYWVRVPLTWFIFRGINYKVPTTENYSTSPGPDPPIQLNKAQASQLITNMTAEERTILLSELRNLYVFLEHFKPRF